MSRCASGRWARRRVKLELRDGERDVVLSRNDQYANAAESFAQAVLAHAHGEGDDQITTLADLVERISLAASRG